MAKMSIGIFCLRLPPFWLWVPPARIAAGSQELQQGPPSVKHRQHQAKEKNTQKWLIVLPGHAVAHFIILWFCAGGAKGGALFPAWAPAKLSWLERAWSHHGKLDLCHFAKGIRTHLQKHPVQTILHLLWRLFGGTKTPTKNASAPTSHSVLENLCWIQWKHQTNSRGASRKTIKIPFGPQDVHCLSSFNEGMQELRSKSSIVNFCVPAGCHFSVIIFLWSKVWNPVARLPTKATWRIEWTLDYLAVGNPKLKSSRTISGRNKMHIIIIIIIITVPFEAAKGNKRTFIFVHSHC